MDVSLFARSNKKDGLSRRDFLLAEEKGFEPLQDLHLLSVFETDPFSRLGIPPTFNNYSMFTNRRHIRLRLFS